MRNTFRYLSLAAILLALAGCSTLSTKRAAAPETPAAPATKPAAKAESLPPVQLDADLLYKLLVAEVAGQRGHLKLAAQNYLAAAYETRDPRVARRAARIAIYAREFDDALEAAQLWADEAPKEQEAQRALAALLVRTGKVKAAEPHLKRLLAMTGDDIHGWLAVADILSRSDQKAEAAGVMERLAKAHGESANALYGRAELELSLERTGQAQQVLEQLLKKRPHWSRALALKANLLLKQGKTDEAITVFGEAVKQAPDDASLRLAYARLLVNRNRISEARQQFRELSRRLPNNTDVTYALGLLALQAGDLDSAEKYFMRLVGLGVRSDASAYALGQIAEARGNTADAIKWYSAVGEGPTFLESRLRVANLISKDKGVDAAITYLHGIPLRTPDEQIQIAVAEGEILREAGDYKRAMAVYDKALAKTPDNSDLLYARALVAEKLDRLDLLERDLHKILADDPDNVQALNALGYTLADRTHRYKEAYGYIKRALAQSPEDPAILDSMGWVLYRMGRTEEALKYLHRAASKMDDPEIAAHLGEVLWVRGEHKEARKVWDKALKAHPDNTTLKKTLKRLTQ